MSLPISSAPSGQGAPPTLAPSGQGAPPTLAPSGQGAPLTTVWLSRQIQESSYAESAILNKFYVIALTGVLVWKVGKIAGCAFLVLSLSLNKYCSSLSLETHADTAVNAGSYQHLPAIQSWMHQIREVRKDEKWEAKLAFLSSLTTLVMAASKISPVVCLVALVVSLVFLVSIILVGPKEQQIPDSSLTVYQRGLALAVSSHRPQSTSIL